MGRAAWRRPRRVVRLRALGLRGRVLRWRRRLRVAPALADRDADARRRPLLRAGLPARRLRPTRAERVVLRPARSRGTRCALPDPNRKVGDEDGRSAETRNIYPPCAEQSNHAPSQALLSDLNHCALPQGPRCICCSIEQCLNDWPAGLGNSYTNLCKGTLGALALGRRRCVGGCCRASARVGGACPGGGAASTRAATACAGAALNLGTLSALGWETRS